MRALSLPTSIRTSCARAPSRADAGRGGGRRVGRARAPPSSRALRNSAPLKEVQTSSPAASRWSYLQASGSALPTRRHDLARHDRCRRTVAQQAPHLAAATPQRSRNASGARLQRGSVGRVQGPAKNGRLCRRDRLATPSGHELGPRTATRPPKKASGAPRQLQVATCPGRPRCRRARLPRSLPPSRCRLVCGSHPQICRPSSRAERSSL